MTSVSITGTGATTHLGTIVPLTAPYATCMNVITSIWEAGWDGDVPVLWNFNTDEVVPSIVTTPNWLHLSVEFEDERAVAFGQGYHHVERELRGAVVVRSFGARGTGETTILRVLDQALAVFRSQKTSGISVIGSMPLMQPGASDDGGWWIRSALAPFIYRFRG